jgi:hypothetical protein
MSRVTPASTMQPQMMPQGMTNAMVPMDQVAKRAYEKWCKRGRPHGTDKQDWYEAEAELKKEMGMMKR